MKWINDPGSPIRKSIFALELMFSWTNFFAEEASCPVQKVGNIGFILRMRGFLRFVLSVEELGMTLSIALIRRSGLRQTPNMVTG